ncbi:MAG: hypothetical protein JNL28_03625 [Planctomycetes bacterium]|nr:hypothetical protein [Planctomycetota bacterium]
MKLTPKQLADQIRRDATRYVAANATDDAEFRRTIQADVRALNAVADLAAAGDVRGAYLRAAKLDTVVREAIADKAWRALSGNAAFGHTRWDS